VINIQRFCEAIAYWISAKLPQPDLLILDLDMPEVSGFFQVKQLQAIAPDLPIIALIGLGQEEMAIGLFSAGLQDYLVKDEINSRALMRVIAGAVSRSRYVKSKCAEGKISDRLEKNRVIICRFSSGETGVVIAESVSNEKVEIIGD
jgi:DNA-binding NarL/FixJ family response regulator